MPNAISSYSSNIEYLKQNWTDKEVNNFIDLVERKLVNLSHHPKLGFVRSVNNHKVRLTIIHKRVALIYRHRPLKNNIELLLFWNTAQDFRKVKL